uniref:MIF4G domain-containing protein n=1 Tax=viral metagenome TaxID=1070528 RepID=A0A6C0HGQ7_9ZZZZ
MEFTSALMYSMRFVQKIDLPDIIKQNISKLRLVQAAYRPGRFVRKVQDSNWREKVLVDYVRRVREVEDPDYDQIFSILNKVAKPTLDVLSTEAIAILAKRDKEFRLRVTTLLFDKAIRGSFYAGIMAEFALKLNSVIPEVSEDLEANASMFGTLYDMSGTLTFPRADEEGFEDKIVAWSKQKDVRRGYSRFLTHLYIVELVPGKILHESMQKVLGDLEDTVVQAKTEKSEENVTQYADFLFEIAKLLPKTAVELRGLIQSRVNAVLKRPRAELPSLNMRSRFKLEDTFKCVQAS